MTGIGHVSLVGAGPGDPDLLTRRAVRRLREADLVLYDALVDPRILRIARRARRFFVGKRAGRHALAQQEIHSLLVRAAKRGQRVVRLKGGDPFVFGRGGEEALALQEAGIPFDIVPGITSAVAAPAAAGIPVTHRGTSAGFLVVSGHDEQVFGHAVAALTPNGITLVIVMGVARRTELAKQLVDRGWAKDTPAAVVADGCRPEQQVWRGTLTELAAIDHLCRSDGPAVIVVGAVAALDLRAAAEPDAEPAVQAGGRRRT
jgi:uroporphyrin-III C-methyltransferase/precorrin-2 dehydrogenase/sirohydrochlorin ferrochelatase